MRLAANGVSALCLADTNRPGLVNTANTLRATHAETSLLLLAVDITNEDLVTKGITEAVDKFGRIDIAIHAAGIGDVHKPTHEVSVEEWTRIIEVNQKGTWLCQRAVLRQMMKQE